MKETRNKRMNFMHVIMITCGTLLSRVLGFIRELIFIRGLGARALSDAFLTALRIPNTVYEISAGGAFGPAVLPALVEVDRRDGRASVNRLITALVAVIGLISFSICTLIMCYPHVVLTFVAPGFSPEQMGAALIFLRILIFYLVTSTLTALLAEALRAIHHFFIPSLGQVVVNTIFIMGLIWCLWFETSILLLAYAVVLGGCIQLCVYAITCAYFGYRFALPDNDTWWRVVVIIWRIVPCMITSGISEIALFIELRFASYLPVGSVSLVTYASSFMRLPFGVLVYPLVTVLLPTLSRIYSYSPRRAMFLVSETCKLVLWILVPIAWLLGWYSYDLFKILYLSPQFSLDAVIIVHQLLIIKLCGLIFLAMNHIMLQLFYVRHETYLPTLVSVVSSAWSILLTFCLLPRYGVYGIAISGVLTTALRTMLFFYLLRRRMGLSLYKARILHFLRTVMIQWIVIFCPLLYASEKIRDCLRMQDTGQAFWYADGFGLWLWLALVYAIAFLALFYTRTFFGVKLYFFKK